MHWQFNKERLLELCYQVKGEPVPKFDSRYHLDIDNFCFEKWVNLDLWNEFLKMRAKKGKHLNIKQKKILLNQLKDLKNKKLRPQCRNAEIDSERLGGLLSIRPFPQHPCAADIRSGHAQS